MPPPTFTIRGHHLNVYAELASLRSDPQDLARAIVEGRLNESKEGPDQRAYAQDVIGTTNEEAGLVASRYRAIFTRFVELDKDDLVVITSGEKDHMCQSCIIGNHCAERGLEMAVDTEHGQLQVYEQDLGDMHSIQAFKRLAERLAAHGDIEPALGSYTIAYVPKPTPEAVPIIEANMVEFEAPIQARAGYAKEVLAHWGLAQSLRF